MMTSKEMLFKIDNVILTTKSRVNHVQISIQNKYQMMMLLLAGVKFIKTIYIFRYHTKDVSNQVSSYSDLESKSYFVQITVPKWEKTKKWEKMFWITKRGYKRIANRGRFWGLQIGARGVTNWGIFRDFKSRQKDYKSGQRLQIGAGITNWCRTVINGNMSW